MTDPVAALAAAVAAIPGDTGLRLKYAEQLLLAGKVTEAIEQASVVLTAEPGHAEATALVTRAAASIGSEKPDSTQKEEPTVDWQKLEEQLETPIKPPFVLVQDDKDGSVGLVDAEFPDPDMNVSIETMTLADVGGLDPVKKRINEAFLEPMRHPEIAKAFGKSLRGGLLLYGPPGCGKTFIARAIAGELKAHFISVTVSDILDKWLGNSEDNMHEVFVRARQLAPAVLFFDEVDAVGGKRSGSNNSAMRNVVNQMLQEMDGIGSDNDGLFVLAATNHPWDVDNALLRPGRFDRMVLVLPPDEKARDAILHVHLRNRPVEGIDIAELVSKTDGFSGADLQHVCSTAAEKAMMDSIAAGAVRPITMNDMRLALAEIKSSIGPWMQSAKNVANFGNASGQYDDLVDFLKKKKLL
jgi:SpoVK/Ycf46/Vps4 family AAA+-type ATPase